MSRNKCETQWGETRHPQISALVRASGPLRLAWGHGKDR